jgi:hypothetical protein
MRNLNGTRVLSDRQLLQALAFGLKTVTESDLDFDKAAGEQVKVWDDTKDTRCPVLIRIQNLGTEPIKLAEDLGGCSANQFTHVLMECAVADDGSGTVLEWDGHIPKNIYIFCASAYRVSILKRYADEN